MSLPASETLLLPLSTAPRQATSPLFPVEGPSPAISNTRSYHDHYKGKEHNADSRNRVDFVSFENRCVRTLSPF